MPSPLLGDLPLCAKPILVEHLLNAKTRLSEPVPTGARPCVDAADRRYPNPHAKI